MRGWFWEEQGVGSQESGVGSQEKTEYWLLTPISWLLTTYYHSPQLFALVRQPLSHFQFSKKGRIDEGKGR